MSNSNLATFVQLSPNCTHPRDHAIDRITIHHMAGNGSIETCGRIFADPMRQASATYGVGSDGRIGQYVDEGDRPWTSSSYDNDRRAVTIEVANDGGAPDWHVSDKALEATIALCVDICRRNNIKALNFTGDTTGNLTMHKWFAATGCPGPYLESKFPYIAAEVNRRLGAEPAPQPEPKPGTIYRVQLGAFTVKDNAERLCDRLHAEGYEDAFIVSAAAPTQPERESTPPAKSDSTIAAEVLQGLWGSGTERRNRLEAAGYDYNKIQQLVNELL